MSLQEVQPLEQLEHVDRVRNQPRPDDLAEVVKVVEAAANLFRIVDLGADGLQRGQVAVDSGNCCLFVLEAVRLRVIGV